ncbi:MAG: LuxR C-terminal-related transcriptional regulator [Elusimicrobiota bacterium]|nr:MAG: LuxR C-terminal-related transcriptional regulator [Elusimicrobiota bacterium]
MKSSLRCTRAACISPSVADAIFSAGAAPAVAPSGSTLTDRELAVLKLLADGHTNKAVATKLGISVRTAETHRENLAVKLNIFTVAGLTKYAISHSLTSL